MSKSFSLTSLDANQKAVELGSVKVANTFLVGMLAKCLSIDKKIWKEAIEAKCSEKIY